MSSSTLLAASFVVLLAATGLTGCAETVTVSSRHEPGTGALGALSGGRAANTPAAIDARVADRPTRSREPAPREVRSTRFEPVCRMCR
jgi:hypothetical protein